MDTKFVLHRIYYLRSSCPAPFVITQIRGHIAPLRYVPRIWIGRRMQHFLPVSTHIELCLPNPYLAISTVGVIFEHKSLHTEIRTHGFNARLSVVFEVNH